MKLAMSACAFLLCCFLLLPGLGAQASQPGQQAQDPTIPQQPVAPLPANGPAGTGQPRYNVPTQSVLTQPQPDTHALSGIEDFTTGSLHRFTNMFDPGLSFSELGYTAPAQTGSSTLTSGTTVVGTLDALKAWTDSNLRFNYSGSDIYYYPTAIYGPRNLPSHNVALSLTIVDKRWTFRLRDSFLYSWQAGFGSLFTGGPAAQDQLSPMAALQPSLNPLGTVLTGFARQVNDSSSAEVDYSFSRRTTVTLSGSYGLLDFLTSGYLSSHTVNGRAGYNYALSPKNTLALFSEYDRTSFNGTSTRFDTDLIQASFGRRITGRLAFQIAAGPELTLFHDLAISNRQQLSWSLSGSLIHQTPRTGYSLSYFRGVSPGSGIYLGAHSDTVTGSGNRRLSQFWSGSINGGYAGNTALVPSANFASTSKDWFAGASLGKQIGRHLNLGVNYQYQRQIFSSGACPVLSCGVVPTYQVFGVTIHWHPWPKIAQ